MSFSSSHGQGQGQGQGQPGGQGGHSLPGQSQSGQHGPLDIIAFMTHFGLDTSRSGPARAFSQRAIRMLESVEVEPWCKVKARAAQVFYRRHFRP